MTRHEMEHWDALIKRRDWLESRIVDASRNGKDLSYDKQELSALRWIMDEYLRLKEMAAV